MTGRKNDAVADAAKANRAPVVAALDLGQSSNAWACIKDASFCSFSYKLFLVEQAGAGSDNTHVTF